MPSEITEIRIDKWLWCVRIFKTRSLATDACNAGKIKMDGVNVKASRHLKIGDEIFVQQGMIRRSYLVKALLANRVSAKVAVDYVSDITPEEELKKIDILVNMPLVKRDRGTGRPTKKDRRDIDKIII